MMALPVRGTNGELLPERMVRVEWCHSARGARRCGPAVPKRLLCTETISAQNIVGLFDSGELVGWKISCPFGDRQ